jgi:hypothetical protein
MWAQKIYQVVRLPTMGLPIVISWNFLESCLLRRQHYRWLWFTKPGNWSKLSKPIPLVLKKLLAIETPNVKNKTLCPNELLLPLPAWVSSDKVQVPIDVFKGKLPKKNAHLKH